MLLFSSAGDSGSVGFASSIVTDDIAADYSTDGSELGSADSYAAGSLASSSSISLISVGEVSVAGSGLV